MKNAVVTGANQGIGLECVRLLAQAQPPVRTVLAARNEERGRVAAAQLHSELAAAGVSDAAERVVYHQLDITDAASVEQFAAWAAAELKHVDMLINNAGE